MAELVPTATKKIIKNQPFMLEERFTYQNVEKSYSINTQKIIAIARG